MSFAPSKFSVIRHHLPILLKITEEFSAKMQYPKLSGLKMVDIGSGPGISTLEIVESQIPKDFEMVIGLDKYSDMVDYFNQQTRDPRIQSRQFDILSGTVPEDLKGKFDLMISTYCLSYMRNLAELRSAFRTCAPLLKPGGEFILIWCKTCNLYDVYKVLSTSQRWMQYAKEYATWNEFYPENTRQLIEENLHLAGLEMMQHKDENDVVFEQNFDLLRGAYVSLDSLVAKIPEKDSSDYRDEFKKVLNEILTTKGKFLENSLFRHNFPTIAVAGRKY